MILGKDMTVGNVAPYMGKGNDHLTHAGTQTSNIYHANLQHEDSPDAMKQFLYDVHAMQIKP